MPDNVTLKYSHCEDWFIFAKDDKGNLYFVSTEMWEEWLDCPKNADHETGAVEKYMLPYARQRWHYLNWQLVD